VRSAFFKLGREDFFRPITGPWREAVVQSIIGMYETFLGGGSRSTHAIERNELKEIVVNAIQDYPAVGAEMNPEDEALSQKDESTKANEIIRRVRDYGWIELFEDPGTRREVYRFTRAGKNAAQWLLEQDSATLRMTQRNVRNTKNSLKAYLEKADPYDLFMALDHSQRITLDLADDIAEIYEKRRSIVAEAVHEIAVLDYVQYMSGKFAPVTAVKLRADNVYRHQDEIASLISQIITQDAAILERLEIGARVFRSQAEYTGSVVLETLGEIQRNLRDAMDTKMRELAAAVSDYTDRTSFLALQASVIASTGSLSALNRTIDAISKVSGAKQDAALSAMAERLAPFRTGLCDESIVRVRKGSPRSQISAAQEMRVPTREERLVAYVRNAEDKAFAVPVKEIRGRLEELIEATGRGELLLSEIDVKSYDDLLLLTHAMEAAASRDFGGAELAAEPLFIRRANEFVEFDEFSIKLKAKKNRIEVSS
jgi:Wadjet anti plasmid transformation system JetA-like protein